jgi:ferredoxin
MAYVIAEPCVGVQDGACTDVCPVDCNRRDDAHAQYVIDPAVCIDCNACTTVCPVGAIFFIEDLPATWRHYAARNAAHFSVDVLPITAD